MPECEDKAMAELLCEVTQETDGGYCAECLTLDIFTQGDNGDKLRSNVRGFLDLSAKVRQDKLTAMIETCEKSAPESF